MPGATAQRTQKPRQSGQRNVFIQLVGAQGAGKTCLCLAESNSSLN